MLKVKASVRPDKYGGVGLFADEFIPKGTVIWEETQDTIRFVSVAEYFQLPTAERPVIEKYSYPVCFLDREPKTIGLILCSDDARYMNHDDRANTGQIDETPRDFSLKDIAKDEELTSNYLDWDPGNILEALGVTTCKAFLLARKK